jgi:GNAT superfamily N-acetyltransferase
MPDGAIRRAAFPGYFQLYVEHAIEDGLVETTPDRAAAALWIPGDGPGAPPEGYTERLAAITGQYLGNFLAFDEQLDRHHPAGTFHHHLAILAVRPDRQGQGIGTALLHAHHAVLEDQHIPAYLEASAPRGAVLYRPHSGQEWEEIFLDLMADLNPKGEGDNSMPANRQHTPRRMGWRAGRSA